MPNMPTEEPELLISGDEDIGRVVAPPTTPRPRSLWWLLGLLIAFIIGVGATLWAAPMLERWWQGADRATSAAVRPPMTAMSRAPLPSAVPLTADTARMVDMRVVQLEERLNRITVEAQSASSNAARAEGLLVAFAARRALDSGTPLGYIEGQLRLRFGQAQPRAVATIINAAREPVTLTDLRAGLLAVSDEVTRTPPNAGWWQSVEQEARALVTLRKATTPSPRPQAALERALRYIDAGRVSRALAEVDEMPGKAVATRWTEYARRYQEARRALDLIETAAILEPRQLRTNEGETVSQTSPLAP